MAKKNLTNIICSNVKIEQKSRYVKTKAPETKNASGLPVEGSI